MSRIGQGKYLSWLLRHGAQEEHLPMDEAGWVSISTLLEHAQMSQECLEDIIENNNKSRYERNETRIRASQGHSLDTMPVTQEALEASWLPYRLQENVWHGTNLEALESIAKEGIQRGSRSHVHLSQGTNSATGKRQNIAVMLAVSPIKLQAHNISLYQSSNGVILARAVPTDCIVGIQCMTKKARKQQDRIANLFPWLQ